MRKHVRVFAVLAVCALAFGAWAMVYGQNNQGNGPGGSTFLITITDANTGAFASRSVITLHGDHSMAAIDSGQEGGPVAFSSQQGTWAQDASGAIAARTIDFSFPFATEGSARVDYKFNANAPANQVAGTIVLTFFPPNGNPLDGGGTAGGTFNFTGVRVTAQ